MSNLDIDAASHYQPVGWDEVWALALKVITSRLRPPQPLTWQEILNKSCEGLEDGKWFVGENKLRVERQKVTEFPSLELRARYERWACVRVKNGKIQFILEQGRFKTKC